MTENEPNLKPASTAEIINVGTFRCWVPDKAALKIFKMPLYAMQPPADASAPL